MLAVADSQIPCLDLTCCCSVGYLRDSLLLDPSDKECIMSIVIAMHAYSRRIISINTTATNVGQNDMSMLWYLASRSCNLIGKFMRRILFKRTKYSRIESE